jgi:hypothetical protein
LAGGLLVIVAASEVRTVRVDDLRRRAALAGRQLRGETIPPEERTAFSFDPEYARFLDELVRRTEPTSTVAVLVPAQPDVYRYHAVYVLAPRRVVETAQIGEADWVAAWGSEVSRVSGGSPVGGRGVLTARAR